MAKSPSGPSRATWMFATACAEFSWEGHDEKIRPAVAAGPPSALRAASSATSSSTTATIRASSPNRLTSSTA